MGLTKIRVSSIILILVSLIAYQNCGSPTGEGGEQNSTTLNGTNTNNPGKASVNLNFDSYASVLNESNLPVNIQNLELCFHRIRLEGPTGVQTISMDRNDIPFSSSGTSIADVAIPAGTYEEIKYYLRGENCTSGKSISFTNNFGTFSESDEIELEFEGQIVIRGNNVQSVQFLMAQIAVALDKVNNSNQIKPFLEQILEGFEHDDD